MHPLSHAIRRSAYCRVGFSAGRCARSVSVATRSSAGQQEQADAQPGGPSEHACGQRSGDLADVRDGEDLAQCLVGRAMARSDVQAGGEREAWWAVGVKRNRKPRVRCTDSRRLRVSDERRDPPDVEKLAKVLISLAREQEPNQPEAATQSGHEPKPSVS